MHCWLQTIDPRAAGASCLLSRPHGEAGFTTEHPLNNSAPEHPEGLYSPAHKLSVSSDTPVVQAGGEACYEAHDACTRGSQ